MSCVLIVLRPQPAADATAERARALGLDVAVAPLFAIAPMAWDAPDLQNFDALLFTSASAVRAAGEQLARFAHLPVVTVGDATADAARAASLNVVETGEADGKAVVSATRFQKLLHLAGRRHAPLDDPRVTSIPVYAAKVLPAPELPAQGVALLHSGRAARRFAAIVADRQNYHLVAISAQVAEEAGPGWASVTAATRPRDVDMLALAAPLCESRNHGV
jgi:uroporphyrinogen-III synthase